MPPPASCPLCQCFCRKMSSWSRHNIMAWRHMTLWCHSVISRDMMSWHDVRWRHDRIYKDLTHQKLRKSRFSSWWPWPSNSSEILSMSMPPPNFGSLCQTVRQWEGLQTDTHTHTDGTDSIPWRGREIMNKNLNCVKSNLIALYGTYILELSIWPNGYCYLAVMTFTHYMKAGY